jgi:hypothetical protein
VHHACRLTGCCAVGWNVSTEGMKALECLMTLLVDEMRDMKRGLTSLHQEFTDLRFVFFPLTICCFFSFSFSLFGFFF